MALAGGVMVFYSALLAGFFDTMERNIVSISLGEIQIHADGYRDDPDLYKRIENPERLISELNRSGMNASIRLYGFGLAAVEANSAGVTIRGVDLEREPTVTQIASHMMKGEWLAKDDQKGVVLGRSLARTLNADIGSEVVLLSQATDGSMANELYRVRGVLKSVGGKIDGSGLLMNERSFRDLMVMEEGAHEITVARKDRATPLKEAVEKIKSVAQGYEVMDWRELSPVVARIMDTTDASLFFMLFIAYAAIGMVTLNAMLMSVFERIYEFGVLKALGTPGRQILALVFTEGMILGLISCVIAIVGGATASLYYQSHGIDLTSVVGHSIGTVGGVAIDAVWYCKVTPESIFIPPAVLLVIVILAVIYPGVKAAMITPVDALKHI